MDILNHVPALPRQEHSMYQTTCPHSTNHLQHHSTKVIRNIIPYTSQSRYPLNSQVLAILFPFATIPATPYYPLFTDSYSPQYGMLMFLLHFMTNTFFSAFLPLSPPPSASTLFLNHTAGPIPCTPQSLTPLTKILVIPPPSFLSHSPDLGCVGAQRIMFPGRFLV